jgi:cytochrome c
MACFIATAIALAPATAAWAENDHEVEEGQKIFKRTCFTCHAAEAGKNKVGPSLFGVVGRKAGEVPGFKYSEAMDKAELTWNDEALDKYIANPKEFMPGNRMAYAGVKKADERKELIVYLKSLH